MVPFIFFIVDCEGVWYACVCVHVCGINSILSMLEDFGALIDCSSARCNFGVCIREDYGVEVIIEPPGAIRFTARARGKNCGCVAQQHLCRSLPGMEVMSGLFFFACLQVSSSLWSGVAEVRPRHFCGRHKAFTRLVAGDGARCGCQ